MNSDEEFWLWRDTDKLGPWAEAELLARAEAGELDGTELVIRRGHSPVTLERWLEQWARREEARLEEERREVERQRFAREQEARELERQSVEREFSQRELVEEGWNGAQGIGSWVSQKSEDEQTALSEENQERARVAGGFADHERREAEERHGQAPGDSRTSAGDTGGELAREWLTAPGELPTTATVGSKPERAAERLLWEGRPSLRARPLWLVALLLGLLPIVLRCLGWWRSDPLVWVGGLWLAALLGLLWLLLGTGRRYRVTTKHLQESRGRWLSSREEIHLADVRAISVRRRGWKGWLGVGSVEFRSGADGGRVEFADVASPGRLEKRVRGWQTQGQREGWW